MARPIPLSAHPDLVEQSFSEHVRPVEDANPAPQSDVLARRRIGGATVPRSPFVEQVPGVDADTQERGGKVVALNLTPSAVPSAPLVQPARPAPAPSVKRTGRLSKVFGRALKLLPPPLARHALWSRNLFLGATLSFADASLATLTPVAFLWKNLTVVSLGLLYLSVPLVPSLALLYHVPALGQAYAPNTLVGGLYLVGLYVSSAVVLMAAALTAGFVWRGSVRLLNHFANAGAKAFPTR